MEISQNISWTSHRVTLRWVSARMTSYLDQFWLRRWVLEKSQQQNVCLYILCLSGKKQSIVLAFLALVNMLGYKKAVSIFPILYSTFAFNDNTDVGFIDDELMAVVIEGCKIQIIISSV